MKFLVCPYHCTICTSANNCSQCEDGYYLSNNLCSGNLIYLIKENKKLALKIAKDV